MMRVILRCLVATGCLSLAAAETVPTTALVRLRSAVGARMVAVVVESEGDPRPAADDVLELKLPDPALAAGLVAGGLYQLTLRPAPGGGWVLVAAAVPFHPSDTTDTAVLDDEDGFRRRVSERLLADQVVTGDLPTPPMVAPDAVVPDPVPPPPGPAAARTEPFLCVRYPARVLPGGTRTLVAYEKLQADDPDLDPGAASIIARVDGQDLDLPVKVLNCDGAFALIETVGSPTLPERCHLQQVKTRDDG